MISSGITKSRPLIAAVAFAALKSASDALGEAPKNKDGVFLVSLIILQTDKHVQ